MSTNAGIVSIRELRSTLRLSQKSFAERIGTSPRSIARWEHGEVAISPPMEEKLEILNNVVRKAKTLMNSDEIIEWFNTRNEALGGKKPIELLGKYEGIEKVRRILAELEWGIIG